MAANATTTPRPRQLQPVQEAGPEPQQVLTAEQMAANATTTINIPSNSTAVPEDWTTLVIDIFRKVSLKMDHFNPTTSHPIRVSRC
jgi:hypothetical protein